MGADLIIATLWIREGESPKWDLAREAIKQVKWGKDGSWLPDGVNGELYHSVSWRVEDDDDGAVTDAKCQKALEEMLAEQLEQLISAFEGGSRELTDVSFSGWRVYVTGGMSWGDSPSDLLDPIAALHESGALEAAGFFARQKVSVLTFHGRHGTDVVGVFGSKAAATRALAELCRSLWEREVDQPEKPIAVPEGNDAAIEEYFDRVETNWAEIVEREIAC